jgi:NCAIR mutase (PurE)-related protein
MASSRRFLRGSGKRASSRAGSDEIQTLLERLRNGEATLDEVLSALRDLPYKDIGWARLDTHRRLRKGVGEVVFGEGKTPKQVARIVHHLEATAARVLVTRASRAAFRAVKRVAPYATYHETARLITVGKSPRAKRKPPVWVVSAGTSDLRVAEEAATTAEFLGMQVRRLYDVGVAGIHRLFPEIRDLRKAGAVIVVAGMEGALPGVVAGLCPAPVIGVPTSVGYGVSFGGIAALLTMLNACASGVAVVNIDNGFGAAMVAYSIVRGDRTI